MRFLFTDMNEEYAREILKWKYDGEYAVYNFTEEEVFAEKNRWGNGIFAVLDEAEKLVGELNVEFFLIKDGSETFVENDEVLKRKDKDYEMWIGWAIKDDSLKKEDAKKFIIDCMDFSQEFYEYNGKHIMCAAAEFNEEAVELYEEVGFIKEKIVMDQGEKVFWMKKILDLK